MALSPGSAFAYRLQQLSFLIPASIFQECLRLVSSRARPPQAAVIREVQGRHRALLARDLANVAAGVYPEKLLFQLPVRAYLARLPDLLGDSPRVLWRKRRKAYRDLPAEAGPERFPAYYRRNFHWQTDGYLSDRSARLYDLGVEILFRGMADVMRRQVIPPLVEHFDAPHAPPRPRLLDLGCGTGRALLQIAETRPTWQLAGLDLSPAYVRFARELLGSRARIEVGDAAGTARAAESCDAVLSVYLFHELPRAVRREVVAEAWRLLRPGGLVVVEDSAQLSDSPALAPVLEGFAQEFHEPFYRDYLRDDLAALLTAAGFVVERDETHLVARVLAARKPTSAAGVG